MTDTLRPRCIPAIRKSDTLDAQKRAHQTVETRSGTVCRACGLWPDACTCRQDHPVRALFMGAQECGDGELEERRRDRA